MDVVAYLSQIKKLNKPKFRNKRCVHDGMNFDSMKERNRWIYLCHLVIAKEISLLQRQVVFPIVINGIPVCKYYADFTYKRDGQYIVEDSKSPVTRKDPTYRLKKKLLHACLGIEILET